MISLVRIGRTGGTQGKEGFIKFFPEENQDEILQDQKFLFFYLNGNKVPVKVLKCLPDYDPILINFEDYNSPELASPLLNKEVYIELREGEERKGAAEQTLIDFIIVSSDEEAMGKVIDIEQHPKQILLLVDKDSSIYRVPFHQDLILDIDPDKMLVYYQYSTIELQSMLDLS